MAGEETMEAGMRGLHEIVAQIDRLEKKLDKRSSSEVQEMKDKLTAGLERVTEMLDGAATRRGEFNIQFDDPAMAGYGQPEGMRAIDALINLPPPNDEIKHIQRLNDDMVFLRNICRTEAGGFRDIRSFQHWHKNLRQLPTLQKALDTGATGFSDWIPTIFSASLHELLRVALKVPSLHTRIDMPHDPYALPIEGADAGAYLVAEQGQSDANLDVNKMVCPSFSNTDPLPTVLTLTSKKLGVRMTFSEEAREESIIPVLNYLRGKAVRAMADAQENTTINGDLAGSHMDSDVTLAMDARKAWNGYRKISNTASAAVTISNSASAITKVSINDIRTVRARMGKYATDPQELTWVVSPAVYIKLLGLEGVTAGDYSPVQTVDKYGDRATIVTGEMARVDGTPIIISGFQRENLGAGGVYTGGATVDRSVMNLVRRDALIYGDRRAATIKSREIIETDQTVLVMLQRLTFAPWYGTDPVIGTILNIKI